MTEIISQKIFALLEVNTCDLIELALLEYSLKDPDKRIRFSDSEEIWHRTMYELKGKLEITLFPLQDMHFATMGAYPYSSDLFTDLWMLRESGMLTFIHSSAGESWIEKSIHSDSDECLEEWKQKLSDHSEILQSFLEFSRALGDALVLSN